MEMEMEIFQELLLTAAFSIVFAFFLAKLISFDSAADLDQDFVESVIPAVDVAQYSVSAEKNVATSTQELVVLTMGSKTELKFDGHDDAILGETYGVTTKEETEIVKDCGKDGFQEGDGVGLEDKSSEDVESYGGLVKGGVEVENVCEFDQLAVKEGLGEGNGVGFADRLEEVKSGDFCNYLKEAKEVKNSESNGEFDIRSEKEEVRSNKYRFDMVNFVRSDGEFTKVGAEDVEVAVDVVEKKRADEEKGSFLNDEDEWEGIERSELEKRFGALALMVASGSGDVLSKIGSDVQMQLYGLHKVATEGPCYEPQPLVLKVSARAKWHAWQRLGNMNPEVAMEQYINLLSDSIPGWIGEMPEDSNKWEEPNGSLEETICGSKAPDINSSPLRLLSSENERKQEVRPCIPKGDAIGGLEFLEQVMHVDSIGQSLKKAA